MLSIKVTKNVNFTTVLSITGLSTDEKPIGTFGGYELTNGSDLYCMDTGELYMYDQENSKWWKQ